MAAASRYFYPRPPRGGRRRRARTAALSGNISIHVLREEDDLRQRRRNQLREISIHVLREEDDL